MPTSEATVEELVNMIERGELRLPEMQRRYVWRSTRVRDLLDSLYRGYPSGAILVWESGEPVPLQDFAIGQQTNPYNATKLLLDGQQRLTSLSAVINGKSVTVRGRTRPIELLFNLDHPDELAVVTEVNEAGGNEEDLIEDEIDSTEDELQRRINKMTFVVATRKLEQSSKWVKVTDIFTADSNTIFLRQAGITDLDHPLYEKYSSRLEKLRGIRKYKYRMDVLDRTLTYGEVTEIFVRVNSLGAKLRSSDLALAQITAKWRNSLRKFQEFQRECEKNGFDLDLGIYLKNLVAFATGQSRFLRIGSLALDELQISWKESCEGMEFALSYVKSNLGIDSVALLSSPFILITLAVYGHKRDYQLNPEDSEQLRYWTLTANAKGRYSHGSSETLLDQDLAILREGGDALELTERLRQQVGKLDISPGELEGRNPRSAIFKTMFLAFRDTNARDWDSNIAISLTHTGSQHRLQHHHIFPKAKLKGTYGPREIDDIANLSFIAGRTNRKISDRLPEEYFPDIIDKGDVSLFEAQCIPHDPDLLRVSAYKEFLIERRKLIAVRLNEFLGHRVT